MPGEQVFAIWAYQGCHSLPDAPCAGEQFDVGADGEGVGVDQEGVEAEEGVKIFEIAANLWGGVW